MKTEKLIRALRDPDYRDELTVDHPVGLTELDDDTLSAVTGGCNPGCGGGGFLTTIPASCMPPGLNCH